MIDQKQLFLLHQAQTSDTPLMLEIEKAEGVFLYDTLGKKYFDLISGISVSNIGHRNPKVVAAIKDQTDKYMHLMVYGEYVQSPQVKLAKLLSEQLPQSLNCTYFVNSGAEAVEGALKLAKRYTGRKKIIACRNGYHGSTQGALSVMSDDQFKNPFQPLLPEVSFIDFNNIDHLKNIDKNTACVITELIQGEAGVIIPEKDFLVQLKRRCEETGTLLIADEIQTGYGRTGTLFALQQFGIIPDILLLAKGMGGGMPIGAFISSNQIMSVFKSNPHLGHITTFGGHPVCCAAGYATLKFLLEENLISSVAEKEKLFRSLLVHPKIKSVRGKGLLFAVEFENYEFNKKVIDMCIKEGVITDWFLFADNALRIAPPLIISQEQIKDCCEVILSSISKAS